MPYNHAEQALTIPIPATTYREDPAAIARWVYGEAAKPELSRAGKNAAEPQIDRWSDQGHRVYWKEVAGFSILMASLYFKLVRQIAKPSWRILELCDAFVFAEGAPMATALWRQIS